jgi:sorbitol/mannitol transport system substrate-binding protein
MYIKNALCATTAFVVMTAVAAQAETLTIATVNNGDMIRMQGYTDDFTAKTGIESNGSRWKRTSCASA